VTCAWLVEPGALKAPCPLCGAGVGVVEGWEVVRIPEFYDDEVLATTQRVPVFSARCADCDYEDYACWHPDIAQRTLPQSTSAA
jgi:hypothetical protein